MLPPRGEETMTLLATHKPSDQQQELREARRLVKERVRVDWQYPDLPAWRSTGNARRRRADSHGGSGGEGEERVAGFRFHAPRDGGAGAVEEGVVEWREREYSTSDDGDGGASDVEGEQVGSVKIGGKKKQYLFEGPDSVGTQLSDRRTARKRKRAKKLGAEMEWNDGLEHWVRRRDAWCGARHAGEMRERQDVRKMDEDGEPDAFSGAETDDSPRSSTSSTTAELGTRSSAATTPDPAPPGPHPPSIDERSKHHPRETLLPIPAPLLPPSHPIRRRITPSTYPEIYSKIILQSRTPSIPLNLQVLINALVKGWKDDGEWPPKPTAGGLEPMIAGRRKKKGEGEGGFRNGVKAAVRVLRLTGTGEVGVHREGA
ncbi:hypothetical protein LTR08_004296 [Meristemomyces frigidus]|nr:hypothetical protein LTR08_004296 [Meristemomyces frigidus]